MLVNFSTNVLTAEPELNLKRVIAVCFVATALFPVHLFRNYSPVVVLQMEFNFCHI